MKPIISLTQKSALNIGIAFLKNDKTVYLQPNVNQNIHIQIFLA